MRVKVFVVFVVSGPGDGSCPQPLDFEALFHEHHNKHPTGRHGAGTPLSQKD